MRPQRVNLPDLKKKQSLSDAEIGKDSAQKVGVRRNAQNFAKGAGSSDKIEGGEFVAGLVVEGGEGTGEGGYDPLQSGEVSGVGH